MTDHLCQHFAVRGEGGVVDLFKMSTQGALLVRSLLRRSARLRGIADHGSGAFIETESMLIATGQQGSRIER